MRYSARRDLHFNYQHCPTILVRIILLFNPDVRLDAWIKFNSINRLHISRR